MLPSSPNIKIFGLFQDFRLKYCGEEDFVWAKTLLQLTFVVLHFWYCLKCVQIRSFSGLHFPIFGLNTGVYSVNFRIQSEYRKIWTRKTPCLDTFHAVLFSQESQIQQWKNYNNIKCFFGGIFQRIYILSSFFCDRGSFLGGVFPGSI